MGALEEDSSDELSTGDSLEGISSEDEEIGSEELGVGSLEL